MNFYTRRGRVPLTRHIHAFDIPLSASTESDLRNTDKKQLRAQILAMLHHGMSYRQIGTVLGIHWTRVGQIARMELKLKPPYSARLK